MSPRRSRNGLITEWREYWNPHDLQLHPVMMRVRVLLPDAHDARGLDARPELRLVDLMTAPIVG